MPEEKKFSSLKEYVNNRVKTIIDSYLEKGNGWVFVLVGLTDIMNADSWKHQIDDYDTFLKNGNEQLFDKNWFKKIFLQLSDDDKDYHILSYPQYTYLPKDIFQRFFGNEKVVFIRDNIRRLFLMDQSNYLEKRGIEDEERPENMPLYQAEQVKLDENYYYTLVTPSEGYLIEDVFEGELKVDFLESESEDIRLLDVNSDKYSLDIFINECFQSNDLSKEVVIKYFPKLPNNSIRDLVLRKLNFLLNLFGGRMLLKREAAISAAEIRPEIIILLKKYWGGAEFRNLKVYKNPSIDKEIINISQGKLVQEIIDEYENAKRGIEPRDLFLTAPTGAGKSLLFQLPAFYISNNGDVTIVVSPLIALMKDQVKGIIEERHFEKVACINGELNALERNKLIENVKAGLIDVVYLSPELLLSYDLSFFIGERNLGLLVIDEAHLITTWGRDFRVDYWYLGNYIRKSRKYREGKFPMVAVTATAVYNGVNDMVFDSIDSLYMQNPRIYIGQVKRDDIEFVINNYESVKKGHEKFKMQQTIEFIKEAVDCKIKTIVYCPYTNHVDSLMNNYMPAQILDYVGAYHAQLDSNRKEYAYKMFKAGKKRVMLCTKAFGMGVDIKDIQVVYHHAPSGMLPDYVQEIGRVARKEDLQGYAMLDYSPDDQNYSKSLHGMSSIRQWQLKEMLKKIYALYVKNGKKRNMLVSVDDFAHIFERELDQKVFTSLTMLEKDYLAKHPFNVLIARPRKLLATVYAKVSDEDLRLLKAKYSTMVNYTQRKDVVELNLAKLWEKHFSDISFPLMKASFYNGSLFKKDGITISPQVIVSYTITMPYEVVYSSLSSLFDMLKFAFSIMMSQNKFFSQEAFKDELAKELNVKKAERIAEFVLSTYSETPFLLRRPTQEGKYNETYQVRGNGYIKKFDDLLKRFHQLFGSTKEMSVSDFITKKDNKKDTNKDEVLIDYIRLGCFLELLDIGTYEMKGGKNPVIFIRLNDPERIERDARNENYENQLLRKTTQKFDDSNRLFDYFFCRKFSTEERWNFIEDFFLGANNDDLEKKYIGENVPNKMDLLQYLKSIEPVVTENGGEGVPNDENDIDVVMDHFLPKAGSWYSQDSMLTIETPNGKITRKISEWLSKDPILLDKTRIQYDLRFGKEELKILNSKVNNQDKGYYTETRGLMVSIEFKGYPGRVRASIPYKDKPLEFYKWWCKNEDKVHLSTAEQIQLFFKVKDLKPNALLKKHEKMISK